MSVKVYEAIYKDEERQGVFGISLVENPAMQDEWIALSEQDVQVQFEAVDESKKLLLGAVLIPNKKIFRDIGGNQFYVTFTEDTIEKLAHDFIKKGFQNSSSAEHDVKLSGVSFVESWQVQDSQIDKSALYGKKYEKGTWVTMAKVSDEIYKQATNGTFKGFSIDALLGLEEVTFNNQIKTEMTEETKKNIVIDIIDGIKAAFSKPEVKEVETPALVEAMEDEVQEEVVDEANPEVQALKDALAEVLAQFKTDLDERLTTIEAKFNAEVEIKEKEVKELEAKLEETPEVEPIVTKPSQREDIKPSKAMSIKERVYANLSQLN